MMHKTYFYGGAFNPLTNSHIEIINTILNEMNNDDLLIIGITDHDYKTFQFSYDIRYFIVKQNCLTYCNHPYKRIKLIKQDKRTWQFLNELMYKNYVLVVGEDEYIDLKNGKWFYSKEILDNFELKVIPRNNGISSTKVRELLKNNATFEELKEYISDITYQILKTIKKI